MTQTSKKVVLLAGSLIVSLLLCEVGARLYFTFEVGPRVLLYGTDWYRNTEPPDEVEAMLVRTKSDPRYARAQEAHRALEDRPDTVVRHDQAFSGYSKFFPNETKSTRDADTGERIHVSINRHGFRGDDFETVKPEGVVRVLTLGASSTFGFYDRDDETYPHFLEIVLNQRCDDPGGFEVINFAIPHSSSEEIATLLDAEGFALDPDAITYYQGRNDSALQKEVEGLGDRIVAILIHRLILAAFIEQTFVGERVSLTAPVGGHKLEPYAAERSRWYLGNLTRILEASREQGVEMIVANQQATSTSPFPRALPERLPLRGVTYQDETRKLRERREAGEEISALEYSLLIHERLMLDLEAWAKERGVSFVDVIDILNQDRHHLLSWVHLHREANRMIAVGLAEPILSKFCRVRSAAAQS